MTQARTMGLNADEVDVFLPVTVIVLSFFSYASLLWLPHCRPFLSCMVTSPFNFDSEPQRKKA